MNSNRDMKIVMGIVLSALLAIVAIWMDREEAIWMGREEQEDYFTQEEIRSNRLEEILEGKSLGSLDTIDSSDGHHVYNNYFYDNNSDMALVITQDGAYWYSYSESEGEWSDCIDCEELSKPTWEEVK
ncbi:MAG: hypothetical protein ACXAB9_12675 [Candidatus Thorarchaeota archaeon]|jgi:hypothetical protein